MKTFLTVVAVLLALAAAAAVVGFSGAYNIAADEPHWAVTERALEAARGRSVAVRSRDVVVPPLADEKRVVAGAGQYAEMCETCHLAPGVADTEVRKGLYPKPPELAHHRMDPRETFWVLKHGIKMTGMPAWGPTHDDDTLWNVVAFLQKLPEMDEKRYRELVGKAAPHMPMHDDMQNQEAEHQHSHGAKPHTH